MKNLTILKGNWKSKKGRLKQRLAMLINNSPLYKAGQEEEIRGKVQAKLGKTKEELKKFFRHYKIQY